MTATTSGDIIVITHNGKPVSEGGKRLGYQAGDVVFILGGGTYNASALLTQKKQEEKAASTALLRAQGVLIYAEIPRSPRWSNPCPNCDSYRIESVRLNTDRGTVWGCYCNNCDAKFLAKGE